MQGWRQRTPDSFRFAAKFPKSITHDKKLEGAAAETRRLRRAMQALGEKLAVLTLQFAYDFTPEAFGGWMPSWDRYRRAPAMRSRSATASGSPQISRQMLSAHDAALVLQDLYYMPKHGLDHGRFHRHPLARPSQRHRAFRPHPDRSHKGTERTWAERVRKFLGDGVDVYGYFNNHFAGHSPASVRMFQEMVERSKA